MVVSSKVEGDVALTRAEELAGKMAMLVAGRLPAARAISAPLSLAASRAHVGRAPNRGLFEEDRRKVWAELRVHRGVRERVRAGRRGRSLEARPRVRLDGE